MKRSMRSAAVCFSCAIAALCQAEEIEIDAAILTVVESVETAAPAAGVLHEVAVREGQTIRIDDPIARIDAHEQGFQAEVIRQDLAVARRESQSDVRVRLANKEHKVAEAELARAASVNQELPNTVSAKEIDRLRLAAERTELEIEHAIFERELLVARLARIEADLRLAEHRVGRMQIASPIAGVVAEVRRHAGEWVDAGETITRVVRVDRLRAEGYLSVTDAVTGVVGRAVTVRTTLADKRVIEASGRVAFVSPEAEPVESKVRFWAEIDNTALRLRPGLAVRLTIHDTTDPPVVATHTGE